MSRLVSVRRSRKRRNRAFRINKSPRLWTRVSSGNAILVHIFIGIRSGLKTLKSLIARRVTSAIGQGLSASATVKILSSRTTISESEPFIDSLSLFLPCRSRAPHSPFSVLLAARCIRIARSRTHTSPCGVHNAPLLSRFSLPSALPPRFFPPISLRERFAPPVLAPLRDEEEVDVPRRRGTSLSAARRSEVYSVFSVCLVSVLAQPRLHARNYHAAILLARYFSPTGQRGTSVRREGVVSSPPRLLMFSRLVGTPPGSFTRFVWRRSALPGTLVRTHEKRKPECRRSREDRRTLPFIVYKRLRSLWKG